MKFVKKLTKPLIKTTQNVALLLKTVVQNENNIFQ